MSCCRQGSPDVNRNFDYTIELNTMNTWKRVSPGGGGSFSRRRFISSCAACGACLAISPYAYGAASSVGISKKMKIRVIYSLHDMVQPKPDWPNTGFNFAPVVENVNAVLRKEFPTFEFLPTLASGAEEAEKICEQDKTVNPDGYIIYQMNCWNQVVQTVAKTLKPVLYVDFAYGGSGGFLVYNARFMRAKQPNVGFVSSQRMEDVIAAVRCFEKAAGGGTAADFVAATERARLKLTPRPGNLSCKEDQFVTLSPDECMRRLRDSKILAVRDEKSSVEEPVMGIPLEYIPFAEVNAAWEKADREEALGIARKWVNQASEVIDVSFEELQNSAAMYLGMKSVLRNHQASAITVNCLAGFYGNHIHAYPCMGFFGLNNEGLIGACECDVRSTATMVAFTTMTGGRPGFISDPVIDTSKRQIIYAHCVAPNKMFGAGGAENPYSIMTHSEDRQGACVRSVLPADYLTTTLKIDQKTREIVFHQAKAVGNDPNDRACRTKLCAEPLGDMEKLFTQWDTWGWHRVTFYGDLKEPVYALAGAMGWKVVEEA